MGTQSSSPATTRSTQQPGEPPSELSSLTFPTRCSTRAGAATEGAPGAATREQTPGLWLLLKKPLRRLSLKRTNTVQNQVLPCRNIYRLSLLSNKHYSKPGSSLATTTPLATAWSGSLEVLELLLSHTVSLEIHAVKSYMY